MATLASPSERSTAWPTHLDKRGWRGRDLRKQDVAFELGADQLAAIDALLAKINAAGTPLLSITREMFSDPRLDGFCETMVADLKWGVGLVIVRGLPVERYGVDDMRKIFWGLGTHFGQMISQNKAGDRTGDVMVQPGSARGYTSAMELGFHTDPIETLTLLCIQRAKSGGENVFLSSLAIREIVEAERPDLMPVLKRGFRFWRLNEQAVGEAPISPYRVPVFGEKDGLKSCWMWVQTAEAVARTLGTPLSDEELEAIAFVESIFERPELGFVVQLERGEAVFINNFEVLHSRQAFTQWEDPAKQRHLLRLWIQSDPPRALPDEMLLWHNPSKLQGIDPLPELSDEQRALRDGDPTIRIMKEHIGQLQAELERKRKAAAAEKDTTA